MPRILQSICGVCPWAHHIASVKALDNLWKVDPPPTAKKLRELVYSIYQFYDKLLNFYFLAGPDFVVGPDGPKDQRNIIGVINKVGVDIGKEVIKQYRLAQEIIEKIGGRKIHPVFGLPGGVSRPIKEEDRKDITERAKGFVEFAKFSLKVFEDVVLKNKAYVDLITSDVYYMKTYYMGMVDEKNRLNFYDGDIRVVDEDGKEFVKFKAEDYHRHIAEQVEPWTYLKLPYLKAIGWKGLVEGRSSGIYRAAPLARLNAAEGMATPLAEEEYQRMYSTLGGKPAHFTLAFHWARLVELLYAAERGLELALDPEVSSPDVRRLPQARPEEGIGVVEAPRGTLFHHYWTDAEGIITRMNLIVATGNNYPAMCLSLKKVSQKLIKQGKLDDGILNMVEMAFRAYDPCLSCATHSLGEMPLVVNVYNSERDLIQKFERD
jgi:F420-non-reducing hydrogenase large subunit